MDNTLTANQRPRTYAASTVLCLASALAFFSAGAGPLNPPGGPVAPTTKPLSEVEPRIAINATNTPGDADSLFKITQPGSYYLTGNITGVAGKHGIEIGSSGVTLDLNGFDLVGIAGMGAFDGVSVTVADLTNIEVRNGSVRSWGDEGIDLGTFPAFNCTVRDVRSSANAGYGILVSNGSSISGCAAYQNGSTGIVAGGTGCTISACTARANGGDGIAAGFGSTIDACAAYDNASDGIVAAQGSTVSGCTAYINTANGISTNSGCTISACTTSSNAGSGISASSGSTITGCSARSNSLDGIRVAAQCVVISNACASNGANGDGAGIHTTGSDNRIEGNNCISADRGIDVDIAGNIIIRNTCSGNTNNWDIVANNVVGPILDRTAPASAAILGNSAPDSTGSTHPNANFTY